MGTLHPPGKMAKLLCMLAWAGAATAAPTSSWNPSSSGRLGGSEDALVARVMGSLGPSINSAIAAAMGGLSSGTTLTRGSPVTTFQGSVTNGPATSVQFSGTSKGVNSQSKWTSSSSSSSKESSFSSSTLGGTGLTGSSFGSSGFGSSSLLGSSSLSQGQVVESVLSALGPSITSAVEAATAEQGSKTTTSNFQGSSSSFQGSNQNRLTTMKAQQSSSSVNEASIVQQIISALTPSITQSVSSALAG